MRQGETCHAAQKWKSEKPRGNIWVVGVFPLSRGSESGCTGILSILFNGAYHLLEKRKHAPAFTLVWKHTVYTASGSACVTSVAAFLLFLAYRHTLSLLGAIFCAAVFAAKSHSLSSKEVQKPTGRWYVTESRLCTNVYQTGAAKVDFMRSVCVWTLLKRSASLHKGIQIYDEWQCGLRINYANEFVPVEQGKDGKDDAVRRRGQSIWYPYVHLAKTILIKLVASWSLSSGL